MPRKPMKPCRHPGCPKMTDGLYCEEHKDKYRRNYEKYERNPRTAERYGYQWKKIRRSYVKAHPFCEMCLLEQRVTPVEEVHHIYSLDHGGSNDAMNLMSLCKPCHSRITALMGDRWNKKKEFTY